MTPDPLDALRGGFVDPASPGALPAPLRQEAGLALATWLRDQGVTPATLADATATFARCAQGELPTRGWPGLRDDLPTLAAHYDSGNGAFVLFTQEAMRAIDGPAQWEGFLRLLHRLSALMALPSASLQ